MYIDVCVYILHYKEHMNCKLIEARVSTLYVAYCWDHTSIFKSCFTPSSQPSVAGPPLSLSIEPDWRLSLSVALISASYTFLY